MRSMTILCFVVLTSSLLAAQADSPAIVSQESNSDRVEIQKLQEAMAAQLRAMREQQEVIAEQQRQIAEQGQAIENLRLQLGPQLRMVSAGTGAQSQRPISDTFEAVPAEGGAASRASDPQEKPKESPLSFRIGGADFIPGGFLDLTYFWRSTNVGSGYGTNFFSIPFRNTIPGQLTENRITAENSRISLQVKSSFSGNDVWGYIETDFHGNDPGNLNVATNSSTLRLRQYWANIKHGRWELMAGQGWSWLTPNRVGMSSYTPNLFYTLNQDANYNVGFTWTRAPQVRGSYHPNDHWGLGVGLENPNQFVGQANQVTFPAAFSVAPITTQFDAANQTTTPNLHPDVLAKIAYDSDHSGKHYHVEGVGLLLTARLLPALGGTTNTKTGGGVSGAVNLELVKNFRVVANGYWSDGGGRYLFGNGPSVVVTPAGTLSLVHAGAGLGGFEWQASTRHLLAAYYGFNYFQRNFFLDTSAGALPNTFVGYGGPRSSNAANKSIQEPTGVWIITFWKDPQHGALQLINQVSYLTRVPWVVAAGTPRNARSTMVWSNIRYTLP